MSGTIVVLIILSSLAECVLKALEESRTCRLIFAWTLSVFALFCIGMIIYGNVLIASKHKPAAVAVAATPAPTPTPRNPVDEYIRQNGW